MTTIKEFKHLLTGSYLPDYDQDPISHLDAIDLTLGNIINDHIQVGEIVYTADDAVPTGFLQCDGSAVNRTTYADLFAVIGEMYGNGDGSTTFNLPDYQGWFHMNWGSGPSASGRLDRGDGVGGIFVGTYQLFNNYPHSHTMHRSTTNSTGGGAGICKGGGSDGYTSYNGGNEFRCDNKYVYMTIKY